MTFQEIFLMFRLEHAVFTENKWSSLKNAHITCLDYSIDMLGQARKRLGSHAHIKCIQGDVGNLQMENESVDTVVSMNGFHAFPDKQKAFHEIWRVLKPGGKFHCLLLYQGKIETDRLAGKKYSCKERVVFSTVSDGERAKKYPSRTI